MASDKIHMKPLLSKIIQRAVVLAISDCIAPPAGAEDSDYAECDERQRSIQRSVYNISEEDWAQIDPMALAQNVCCRLLGMGDWVVNGVYSANSTVQQVVNACFGADASRDPLGDIVEDLGLKPADAG